MHYLCCDPLWTAVISSAFGRVELLQLSPMKRLCLSDPSVESARLLALAFNCYHALKLANRDLIDKCVQEGDFDSVQEKLVSLAAAFKQDLAI